ncbi:MAG TPA: hypothetical protein VMG30_07235 [Acidobacteriota bacterium]|nr:hypothetical protein [Acidobacteriota bacterium]
MDNGGLADSMLTITTLFLFGIFIGAEFYRFRQRITGSVREIQPLEGDFTGLMGAHLKVTTPTGEITAFVSGCQMCVHQIGIGQTVSLVPGPDGYVLQSPWVSRRGASACPRTLTL